MFLHIVAAKPIRILFLAWRVLFCVCAGNRIAYGGIFLLPVHWTACIATSKTRSNIVRTLKHAFRRTENAARVYVIYIYTHTHNTNILTFIAVLIYLNRSQWAVQNNNTIKEHVFSRVVFAFHALIFIPTDYLVNMCVVFYYEHAVEQDFPRNPYVCVPLEQRCQVIFINETPLDQENTGKNSDRKCLV